jgi:tape measure domain-containing protein
MAQGAGIQLEVGLDLAYFRNQLVGLQAVTTGTKLSFGVTFKRLDIQNELNALATNIKKRNYFLEVKTNLASEIDNAKKLADALSRLQQVAQGTKGALPIGTGALGLKKSAGQPGANEIRALYEALAMAGAEGFETGTKKNRAQMVAQIGAVAKDTVAGLLNGLDSQDAKVQAAAKSLGESLITSMKAVLGIASPSKKFEEIGKNVGKGFEKGALSSMDNAFDALENKMRQRGKILDTVARGIFRMLGMDPAAMLQQARQQRLPAAINWQATTPPRQPFAGPSSGGRALPPGPSQAMLSGTSFGRQKYLPTALGEELKKVLRDAANAFVDTLKSQVRAVKILDFGKTMQPSLTGSRVAGLLPAAAGRTPSPYSTGRIGGETQAELFARREREARMRSLFGSESQLMLPPARPRQLGAPPLYQAPSLPSSGESAYLGGRTGSSVRTRAPGGFIGGGSPSGGGPEATAFVNASRNALAYSQALGKLQESLRGVQSGQLPLVGSIKGLAGEFAQATKQVLLYGTAYKALAFLTSLPGEAFNAAKALGTYKNQLQAVTAETGTFSTSLAFVDGLAQRFNVPLESARQGFVKLYASMQPAGFNQEQIEGLFTGISQSAAAFGLSADKVDRVNYAFAQMASKGQIMSEELKGQLGDVLPGALALFAEAAKMSIPEFSKAMEDGRFQGDAMVQVLENVGILMKVKFGAAAEGAAKTLQGALNGIQNNLKLMYEALGPVVNRMAAVFGPQITSLIKSATDVIKAFELGISTTGDSFAAMSPQAQGFYSSIQSILPSIKSLVPSFVAAAQNIGYFAASLATASQPLLGLLKLALDFISIPFVARVGVYATVIGLLTSAFTLLKNTGIVQATIAMIRFMATLTVGQVQAWIGSIQAAIATLVAMIRTANLARLGLMALKVTLISFGVGAVLIGLDFVAQRLLNIGAAADDARKRTAELTDELARAVETGNVALASQKYVEGETKAQSLAKSKQVLERFQGGFQQGASLTKQEYQQLQRSGLATGISFNERKGRATATSGQVAENLRTAQAGYVEALNASGSAQEALNDSIQVAGNMQRELEASRGQMKDIPPATGADDGTGGAATAKQERESQLALRELELAKTKELFAVEMELIGANLSGNTFLRNNLELQKQLIEFKYQEKEVLLEQIPLNEQASKINRIKIDQQLAIEQSLARTQLELRKEAKEIKKTIQERLQGYVEENQFQQRYIELVRSGIKPALAQARVEIEKAFNAEKKQLEQKVDMLQLETGILEAAITKAQLTGQSTANEEKTLKLLQEQLKVYLAMQGKLPGQMDTALTTVEQTQADRPIDVRLEELAEASRLALEKLQDPVEQIKVISDSVSESIGSAFKGLITGATTAQEALANVFQSIADSFADMVAQMITEYLKMQLIQGIMSLIPGLGSFGGGASIGQAVSMPTSVGIGAGGGILQNSMGQGFGTFGPNFGIRQFANGGIVTGPTLGLVGEGRYNEAVIPLPDGKSVPVDLGGAMGGQAVNNIVVHVDAKGSSVEGNEQEGKQLGRAIAAAVQQELIKQKRPGGLLV